MQTIKLSQSQIEGLYCSTYAEYPEGSEGTTLEHGEIWGGELGVLLRNELRAAMNGNKKIITVTPFFIKELREFADRDSESDCRMYTNLLKRVTKPEPCAVCGKQPEWNNRNKFWTIWHSANCQTGNKNGH